MTQTLAERLPTKNSGRSLSYGEDNLDDRMKGIVPMKDAEFATWPDSAVRDLRRRLLAWFPPHARDLPWRRTRDPYRIWVSEVMLQQTQVATVVPYYERFVAEFPDVGALAEASEERVLRHWEGLGYYRRARHLHAAARQIVAAHGGRFPRTIELVRSLPGIGPYTAGAILSIAHDDPYPILEANTVRLYCRLLAFRDDPSTQTARKRLWQFAQQLVPPRDAGLLNQALMELGSLVCTPRAPDCAACPLRDLCPTRSAGLQDQIPAATKKVRYEDVREAVVVVRRGPRVLVRQRSADERWAGMWDFPRFAWKPGKPSDCDPPHQWLVSQVRELTRVTVDVEQQLAVIKHGVTRFRITLHCFAAQASQSPRRPLDGQRWVTSQELHELPLSVTGRKIARLIESRASRRT